MRILFISAFYPPYVVGGWEQLVRDINQRLQARGHVTRVLTSMHGISSPQEDDDVARLLTLESDLYHYKPSQLLGRSPRLRRNLAQTRRTIESFRPDIVFVHVMWNLNRAIAWQAEALCPGRVVYYVANNWPYAPDPHVAYLRSPARDGWRRTAKQVAAFLPLKIVERESRAFPLKFEHVLCVSQAIKTDLANHAAIPPTQMSVVYNGVETDLFTPSARQIQERSRDSALSLIYAGSLVSHKGVHTAVEAMALLARRSIRSQPTLTIVGAGHPEYEARLREMVRSADIEERVRFLGRLPREEIPSLFQQHDALLFPSIWEEPLARTMQEAMAAGLVVIGTLTGGSGELLVDGETGLSFPPGDAAVLAQRIEQLNDDPDLARRLAHQGRARVLRSFSLDRMIDEIETYFRALVPSALVNASPGM